MRSLSSVREGDHVQVKWKNKFWYDADVVGTDDDDAPTSIYISWCGWAKRHDEWVDDPARVRKPRTEAELAVETAQKIHKKIINYEIVDGEVLFHVEKVLGKRTRSRKVQYQVKWLGYENHPHEYTWEPPSNIPDEYIDEFEAEQLAAQQRNQRNQRTQRKRERPAAVPFSVQAVAGVEQAVREQRRDDAEDLEEAIGRAGSHTATTMLEG